MSYLTLEVEIDHGREVSTDSEKLSAAQPRPARMAKGLFIVPEDFNVPLPDEVLRSFEGK